MIEMLLESIFDAAVAAVDPFQAVINAVRVANNVLLIDGATYDLADYRRVLVIGAGKATARMAQAVESLLGERIAAGLIVVKDGHTRPLNIIEQVEAAHPVPDEAGVKATRRIRQLLQDADAGTLVICLLSGGASALLVGPVTGCRCRTSNKLHSFCSIAAPPSVS